jgi:hypothetical protein
LDSVTFLLSGKNEVSATLCDWRTMLPARSKMQSRFSAKQEERGKVPSGRAAIRSLSPVSGQSQMICGSWVGFMFGLTPSRHPSRLFSAFAASAVVVLASLQPSTADEFKALTHQAVVGRCHMDFCWWFSIEAAQKIGSSSKGDLYAIALNSWERRCKYNAKNGYDMNACGKRSGGEEQISFVFCSKQKPAMMEIDNDSGKWNATLLEPGNSDAIIGATESGYAIYWAACHGVSVKDVYKDGDRLGKALGYPFKASPQHDQPDLAIPDLSSPFDVLNW